MLDLVLALMLAGADLNSPGIGSPGLDDRSAGQSQPAARAVGADWRERVAPGERVPVEIVITTAEERIIRDYFDLHPCALYDCDDRGGLPPGLAKMRHLPPGLAGQLARNGRLPPGLAKRGLPDELVRMLPARPAGQRFVMVDDRVLLMEQATDVILDMLEIVIEVSG